MPGSAHSRRVRLTLARSGTGGLQRAAGPAGTHLGGPELSLSPNSAMVLVDNPVPLQRTTCASQALRVGTYVVTCRRRPYRFSSVRYRPSNALTCDDVPRRTITDPPRPHWQWAGVERLGEVVVARR